MSADAAASSEDADEADFLNSESEHSDEEELNPDDFSEDVSCTLCFTLQTVWKAHHHPLVSQPHSLANLRSCALTVMGSTASTKDSALSLNLSLVDGLTRASACRSFRSCQPSVRAHLQLMPRLTSDTCLATLPSHAQTSPQTQMMTATCQVVMRTMVKRNTIRMMKKTTHGMKPCWQRSGVLLVTASANELW